MSPEQIRGTVLKEMSDVYAAGLLLFGMLTGRNPFPGRDAREVCEMNLWAPPPYPRLVRPDLDIPESVENVVMRALRKKPEARFPSMQEMEAALAACR